MKDCFFYKIKSLHYISLGRWTLCWLAQTQPRTQFPRQYGADRNYGLIIELQTGTGTRKREMPSFPGCGYVNGSQCSLVQKLLAGEFGCLEQGEGKLWRKIRGGLEKVAPPQVPSESSKMQRDSRIGLFAPQELYVRRRRRQVKYSHHWILTLSYFMLWLSQGLI